MSTNFIQKNQNFYFAMILFVSVFSFSNCKQENPVIASTTVPEVITTAVTNTTSPFVTLNGEVVDEKGSAVTQRGFCWGVNNNPTVNDTFSTDNFGVGIFSHVLSNLVVGTLYYVKAYATNSYGTAYGNEVSFTYSSGGGIVFYVDGTGEHGLICSSNDQGYSKWSNSTPTPFIGTTLSSVGSGQNNTNAIINGDTSTTNAANICNDLVLNGFSDWYLPSQNELNLIYTNLSLGGTVFWSSTESLDANKAFGINTGNGVVYETGKHSLFQVRAIRSF